MLRIEVSGTWEITRALVGLPAMQAVHSTNSNWDLLVETNNETFVGLDQVLVQIRLNKGGTGSQTSILLSAKKM